MPGHLLVTASRPAHRRPPRGRSYATDRHGYAGWGLLSTLGAAYAALLGSVAVASAGGLGNASAHALVNAGLAVLWGAAAWHWFGAGDDQTRLFWRRSSYALAALSTEDVLRASATATGLKPLGSLALIAAIGSFPTLLWALGTRCSSQEGAIVGASTILDAAIIAGSLGGLLGSAVVMPALAHGDSQHVQLGVNWLITLFETAGLVLVLYRKPADRAATGLLLLLATTVTANLAALAGVLVTGSGRETPPWWITGVYGLAALTALEAPRYDRRLGVRSGEPVALWSRLRVALPYLALGPLLVAAIASVLIAPGTTVSVALVICSGVVSSLVAGRQLLQVADNRRLIVLTSALARRDGLTGLHNRLAFDEDVERRLQEGRPFALIVADVNSLKQVNDGPGGHLAGDRVLRRVARTLERVLRSGDDVYRIGGDEFGVLLEGVDRAGLERVTAAMREQFRAGPVTVASGDAVCPDEAETYEGLFRRADASMYAAKRDAATAQLPPPPAGRRRDDPTGHS